MKKSELKQLIKEVVSEVAGNQEWVVGAEGPNAWEQIVSAPDIQTAIKLASKKQMSVEGPHGRWSPPTRANLNIQ